MAGFANREENQENWGITKGIIQDDLRIIRKTGE